MVAHPLQSTPRPACQRHHQARELRQPRLPLQQLRHQPLRLRVLLAPQSKSWTWPSFFDGLAAKNAEKLDWKRSIVDLMKLVGMDSSLSARKQLATELHYTGDPNDSASMNIWLHKEVLVKLAEDGGKVPPELLA
ncbi:MAG TPA: DUF3597 domain-containing protein [Pyrinomonadaceae bacterium]|nr:DUF3597 domain-containing protein [Pyrinomonadaceae bacterium]